MSQYEVKSFKVTIYNRAATGSEPSELSADIDTSVILYAFGKGQSEKALLPNAPVPLYATRITRNQPHYGLSTATSAGLLNPGPVETGQTVAFVKSPLLSEIGITIGMPKVDISAWTESAGKAGLANAWFWQL